MIVLKKMATIKCLGSFLVFSLSVSLGNVALAVPSESGVSAQIDFSENSGFSVTANHFSCCGKIYARVRMAHLARGNRVLDVRWLRPDGEMQEGTVIPFESAGGEEQTVFFWMEFKPDQKNQMDDFKLGGDYGHRENSFSGDWKFVLIIDKKRKITNSFHILCYE